MPDNDQAITPEELAAIFPPPEPAPRVVPQELAKGEVDGGGLPLDQSGANLDLILDVDLTITVELGRAKKRIRDVIALAPGSVVELDRLAGEAVDVLVNGKPVARGEVVVIGENFGVRITEIIGASQRLRTALGGK